MDVISIFGPSALQRTYTQDEFDARFNFVSPREKAVQESKASRKDGCLRRWLRENWTTHSTLSDYLPALQWVPRYGLKTDLPRDMLGSLLLAALFLPQAVTAGVLSVDNAFAGVYALIVPQLIYPLLGSSRHSSIGSLSFVSLLVQSSIASEGTHPAMLSLVASVVHFIIGLFPLDSILALVPDPLVSGFTSALSLRLLTFLARHSLTLDRADCGNRITDVAFSSLPTCFMSATGWVLILTFICLSILCLSHFLFLHRFANSIPVTPPFQLALMLASIALSYTLDLSSHGVKVLGRVGRPVSFSLPSPSPFFPSLLDGSAIALFGMALHLRIARTIAIEKMHSIDRKQELLAFASFELPLAWLGLPPIGSAHGKAQLNVETARFSLVSNVIAVVWICLFVFFVGPILKYLPYCVVACLAVTSFPGFFGEIRSMKRLYGYAKMDTSIWLFAFGCGLFIPNHCSGFLLAFAFTLLTLVVRVQRPTSDVLVRMTSDIPSYFAEEEHYEGEPLETPAKIYRFNGPLLFANVDTFHSEVIQTAKSIKGALAVGIGTRSASMRSQVNVEVHQKDSITKSSHLNLTNLVINQETPGAPSCPVDSSLLRVLILDCSSLVDIDSAGVDILIDIFFELQEQSIRLLFAYASVHLRAALSSAGFFARVTRSSFFPCLLDAALAARSANLPIHTSVSMNGCRDVITLSTATSNQEIMRNVEDPAPAEPV